MSVRVRARLSVRVRVRVRGRVRELGALTERRICPRLPSTWHTCALCSDTCSAAVCLAYHSSNLVRVRDRFRVRVRVSYRVRVRVRV